MSLEDWTVGKIAVGAVVALLAWGVLTVHQLAVSTAALSASVEFLVKEELPNRVTALEIQMSQIVQEQLKRGIQDGN